MSSPVAFVSDPSAAAPIADGGSSAVPVAAAPSRCPFHALWAAPSRAVRRNGPLGFLRAVVDLAWREIQMLHPRAAAMPPDDGQPQAPPFALVGPQRWPVIGIYHRLKAIITDPVGNVLDLHRVYGDVFTIRIPFNFDLTYLVGREAYDFVTALDAETARMGPVMYKVPTVGAWYPRSEATHENLQELLLVGRSFMARHATGRANVDRLPGVVRAVLDRRLPAWDGEVDLSRELVAALHEIAARGAVGDELWDAIGAEVAPLLRTIVDGIDIPRAALAVTPLKRTMPEWKATFALKRILDGVVAEHRATGRFDFVGRLAELEVGGRPIDDRDLSWMLMYVLWNCFAYTGSYGFWAWVDLLDHPEVRAEAERLAGPARERLLQDALTETIRLHPVASLVRSPARELAFEHRGRRWILPAGGYIGVVPWALTRDPARHADADAYDPLRYRRGEPQPPAFGRGDFGCVARTYVRAMIAATFGELLDRVDMEIRGPIPERRSRVHLTYAGVPVRATVRPRADEARRTA